MKTFGSFMPAVGVRVEVQTSAMKEVADRALALFRDFQAAADQAKAIESEILRLEPSGVPESLYTEYEQALAKATSAHDLYASARQELRDLRAEERSQRRAEHRNLLGCA